MKLIADSDWLLYYCSYSKKGTSQKTLEQSLSSVDFFIKSLLQETQAHEYILCLTIGSNFRYDLLTEYKIGRKGKVKPLYFYEMRQYILDNYPVACGNNLEADDYLGLYHKKYGAEVILSHTDKDMNQLSGLHFHPKNKEFYTLTEAEAKYNKFIQILMGDSQTDGIPGIKGVGIKTAQRILSTSTHYQSTTIKEYFKAFGREEGLKNYILNHDLISLKSFVDFELPELKSIV